uniref:Uncharacterized protein n=1 Tax=Arundo donax TaxID=35708 RepID=A0A0A9GUK9_ARUDO
MNQSGRGHEVMKKKKLVHNLKSKRWFI